MRKIVIFTILSFLCLVFPKPSFGAEENKFGIHILEPSDVNKASQLVNSNGGDWGWVTVVIRDDDMNFNKWQEFMNLCREEHLIPLVRIATHLEGSSWVKPEIADSEKWFNFLNKLNWPISDKYVIIFNEPNHKKEWGNELSPREYARILDEFSSKFKVQSSKFLILNSGLDLAASNGLGTMDAYQFMKEMNFEIPGIFEKLDGWSSHSYPNHGYLGKPWETGRTSVKGYESELNLLKNTFGVKKDLPVFITETGWPKTVNNKQQAVSSKNRYYDEETVALYIKNAFENIWLKDNRVKAITPFVLNYPADPFYQFSWLDTTGQPFKQYETIKSMPKISKWPNQETKFEVVDIAIPPFMPSNTVFEGKIILKNTGQSIWGENENFVLENSTNSGILTSKITLPINVKVKPGEIVEGQFDIKTSSLSGEVKFSWKETPTYKLKVLPESILTKVEYNFWKNFVRFIENIF